MAKKKKNSLSVFLRIEGIILIIAVLLVVVPAFLPRVLGYQTYHVVSGSMEPEIPVGSLVLAKAKEPADIIVGDIIVFRRAGSVVTHRVVEKKMEDEQFITKGDANEINDLQPVSFRELLGTVRHHYAYLGTLFGFFSTLFGKALLIGIIVIGVLLQFLAGKMQE